MASSDQEHSVTCSTFYHLSLNTDWCLEPLEDERRESSLSKNGFWNLHFDHLDSCTASHFSYFPHKQQLWRHVNLFIDFWGFKVREKGRKRKKIEIWGLNQRERERERGRKKQKGIKRERQKDKKTERQKDRATERKKTIDRKRDRDKIKSIVCVKCVNSEQFYSQN